MHWREKTFTIIMLQNFMYDSNFVKKSVYNTHTHTHHYYGPLCVCL